jgi:hypothetical protein
MTCKTQLHHVSGARTSSSSLDTLWYESRADKGLRFQDKSPDFTTRSSDPLKWYRASCVPQSESHDELEALNDDDLIRHC